MASRVSDSLIKRTTLPLVLKINFFSLLEAVNLNIFFGQTFCIEVRKKILEMASEDENFTLDHEDHSIFSAEIDRQLLQWLHRRPEDWTLSWGGAGTIFGWGHNHRGQVFDLDH